VAHVEILDVVRAEPSSPFLLGAGIDLPASGDRLERYGLRVEGWVLRHDAEPARIEVTSEGGPFVRLSADRLRPDVAASFGKPVTPYCGFMAVLNAATLPREFELCVDVVDAEARHRLGTVYGRRSPLTREPDDRIQPLLVTTLGRTGSSRLMLLLGQHPSLVVHPPFPFETHVTAYWASMFEKLSSPNSYLRSLVAPEDVDGLWWTGHEPFPAETYVDQDPGAHWLGGQGLDNLARFARRQIVDFYEVSAAFQGKSSAPRYFVEKWLPTPLRRVQHELFSGSAEIFLVRDCRDVLASILAFNEKRGSQGFQQAGQGHEAYVAFIRESVEMLWSAWHTADNALLVRYEDLVHRTPAKLAEILDFLKLDASESLVDRMIEEADTVEPEAQAQHRTARDSRASIGRWRHDLPRKLRKTCNREYAQVLKAFGYDPD
jgi:hypothetical protein